MATQNDDLSRFCWPDETCLDLFTRTWTDPIAIGVPLLPIARAGQVIEVCGPSGCAKTTFLLQAVVRAVLPPNHEGVQLGGRAENAVFMDLDNKFDIIRLMMMLHAAVQEGLQQAGREETPEFVDAVMHQSLQRFHLIRCANSFEYLATLRTILPFLKSLPKIQILVIDNVAAFHWLDASVRQPQQESAGPQLTTLTLQTVHKVASATLKMLARQLKLAVLTSKHSFRSSQDSDPDDWTHREVMSKCWSELVSQRLQLKALGGGAGDLPAKFGAKMETPEGQTVYTFALADLGIVPSSW